MKWGLGHEGVGVGLHERLAVGQVLAEHFGVDVVGEIGRAHV